MKKFISLLMTTVMLICIFSGLSVTATAVGDSISNATEISFNTSYSGSITEDQEICMYTFTLKSAGRINIDLQAYIYRTNYYLYDAKGNTIWSETYEYWNEKTKICTINKNIDLTKGIYYFAIESSNTNFDVYTGDYNFKITYTSANETLSEAQGGDNQTIKTADTISFDKTYKGQIALNDDKDIYTFTLSSAGQININIQAYINWTDYYLYDADGNNIWAKTYQYWNSTSEVYTMNENIDLTKGTYYFAIEECYSGTGNYKFKITYTKTKVTFSEEQNGDNQTFETADNIVINKTYKGQLAINDKVDTYTFKLTKKMKVTLKVSSYAKSADYNIYDSNNYSNKNYLNDLRVDYDDTTGKSTFSKTVTLPKGTYYFVVEKFDVWGIGNDSTYTGNYSFSINCAHNYSAKVTKKATTSANGKGTKTCNLCGKSTTYTIYKIKSVSLSKTTYKYNGKKCTPTVVVKNSKGQKLVKGRDYTVKYSSSTRKKVGKYTVTVKFKGSYSGTKKLTFKIKK